MICIQFVACASCNEDSRRFCCNLFFKELIYAEFHYMESKDRGLLGFVCLFFLLAVVYIVFLRYYVQFWKFLQYKYR